MVIFLRGLFIVVLASMLGVTVWASLHQPLGQFMRSAAFRDPWVIATLADAYWAFVAVYVWVAWKEQSLAARALWFIAIILLGNLAIAYYTVIENATGGAGSEIIIGNDVGNVLKGMGGDDVLDGGAGNDSMEGGTGNDAFYVDSGDDSVSEGVGQGTDVVNTGLNIYALPDNVEILIFIGGGVTEPGVLDTCWNQLKPGGRLIANAVTLQSEATLVAFRERHGGELARIAIAQAQPLGGFDTWRAALPITLLDVVKDA